MDTCLILDKATSPVPRTVLSRDSAERASTQLGTKTAQDTGSHSHEKGKRRHLTEDDFSSLGAFFCPSLRMNCSVLLLALQEENTYTHFLLSASKKEKKKKRWQKVNGTTLKSVLKMKLWTCTHISKGNCVSLCTHSIQHMYMYFLNCMYADAFVCIRGIS